MCIYKFSNSVRSLCNLRICFTLLTVYICHFKIVNGIDLSNSASHGLLNFISRPCLITVELEFRNSHTSLPSPPPWEYAPGLPAPSPPLCPLKQIRFLPSAGRKPCCCGLHYIFPVSLHTVYSAGVL